MLLVLGVFDSFDFLQVDNGEACLAIIFAQVVVQLLRTLPFEGGGNRGDLTQLHGCRLLLLVPGLLCLSRIDEVLRKLLSFSVELVFSQMRLIVDSII